ncbi:unnamed protein product (macronuclear) [Paramecium tetraurelia]|uniref:Protein kinase domain-containing protein n=1 Tax=Paramecium tetraurelia TaxID=5888 RepID=A0DFL9_PARTE|nr:uncharacterized protein GSPATT00016649001 [Paramecium tetraurelia]CAK81836.1 unnamed protein product [Paramecium tetraurelia]|eukprot:XP_001449233.1 hypothetical protein (macronuclear) [Paramecium tetraurelia strain d4-2]
MKKKLYQCVPQDLKWKEDKMIIQSQFKKENDEICYLLGFNNYIIITKVMKVFQPQDLQQQPKKYIHLDFDIKFEILRENQVKQGDEDDSLGQIKGISLIKDLGNETITYKKYLGGEKIIKQWREYLSNRINQWQFHQMFKVYKKIGKGNFASVYLAQKIEDQKKMAIKAFSKQAAYAEEQGKEAIVNELKIMRQLNHAHIMQMHEVYETSNSLYVALELLEGGSLYDLIKEKTLLSTTQIQQIMVGVLQGLHHMHQKKIMHRDLKLENILFKQQKQMDSVVIADFGLATKVDEPVYLYYRCGTPGYVAPEVINIKDVQGHYSEVCDIFSLGLVFYLLLSGKQAFPGKSYGTVVKQNREAVIDFKIKQLQQAPSQALDLMKKMLERDPNKRVSATDCLKHPFLAEMNNQMADDFVNDSFDEIDEIGEVALRMNALNEETIKFDAFRRNAILNSPGSPGILDTKQLKQQKVIDSLNQLQMNSPLLNGKTDTFDSIPNIGTPKNKQCQNGFQQSPMIKHSQFKKSIPLQQQNQDNPLQKYSQQQKN